MAERWDRSRGSTGSWGEGRDCRTAAGENAQPELASVNRNVTLVCVLNTNAGAEKGH